MDTRQVFGAVILSTLLFSSLAGCGSPKPSATPGSMEAAATLALVNGTLIDGTGADPVPDAVILIANDKILAVGSQKTIPLPVGVRTIDLAGATILPGFINAHVHRGFNKANLQAWAQGGVTTVRDEGTSTGQVAGLKTFRAELAADPGYARLISAGSMLAVPGGYGDLFVSSPEEAQKAVLSEIDQGVDAIKVALEDGYAGQHGLPKLTSEELKAIVRTAHAQGKPVSGHITQGAYLQPMLEAGVDDIAHLPFDTIPPQSLQYMVDQGVYVTPTFTVYRNYGAPAGPLQDNLRKFIGLGGKVALGNDYGGGPGDFELGIPLYELEMMSQSGMTAMQVILASTLNAAHVLRIEQEAGTLEPGKLADILVVRGDPLQNLAALTDISLVIHHGVVIRDEIQK